MNKKKILSFILAGILVFSYLPTSKVEAASPVLIYEADSKVDNGADYVIIKNTSTADLDLTNWYVADSDRLTRLTDENKIGKVLAAGETLRLEDGNGFNFGLGKSDEVVIFDENKQEVTSFKWSTHAVGAYQYDETTKSYIDTGVVTETSQETVAETPVNVDKSAIVINEIESKDPNGGPDWIELYNSSDTPVDISGWIIADEKGLTLLDTAKTAPFAPGTIIEAKGYLVIETKKAPYDFGMGGGDAVQLFDAEKNLVTSVTYPDHAKDTWGRLPDGQGDLVETKATRGMAHEADLAETPEQPVTNKHIVINEVESNGDDRDWIEIFNNSDQAIDISGWYVSDDSDDHKSALVPSGTMLPAKSYFLFTEVINGEGFFDFGLGGADIARLFNANGELVDSHKWAAHATFGLSRIPNGTGDFKDVPTTRMAENKDAAPVEEKVYNLDKQVWPGEETVTVLDTKATFLEDTSGLDTFGGYLWVVDNDFGKFWKLQMLEDGTTKFAEGWEDGKQVVFKKDANNPDAKGPDTEGISLDANCNVYFATERDNGSKGVNFNTILMVDPNKEGTRLVADNEWDLTDIIDNARKDRGMLDYKVSANLGIETVEYISAAKVDGKIIDQNTGKALKASDYNPINGGFMFVGLEDDGFIYVVSL